MAQEFFFLLYFAFVAGWTQIFNGLYEYYASDCPNYICDCGLRNEQGFKPEKFYCNPSIQSNMILYSNQPIVTQNIYNMTPIDSYNQQLIVLDVLFIDEWISCGILLEYDNQVLAEINYSTNNPLTFNYGLCDQTKYEVRSFNFSMPKVQNNFPYLKFTILNPSTKAIIKNIHSSYQECFQTCSTCYGSLKNECLSCKEGMQVINGECRCQIRKVFLYSQGQCVDQCPVIPAFKIQNRICKDFTTQNINYGIIQWNTIYDPMHIDTKQKTGGSFYTLGIFKFREGTYISFNTIYDPYPLTLFITLGFCNSTPINSGIQFLIDSKLFASLNYDRQQYQYENIQIQSLQTKSSSGTCVINTIMNLVASFKFYQTKFLFSISGNFTDENAGWYLNTSTFSSGNCPDHCLQCNQFFQCVKCYGLGRIYSDGTCVIRIEGNNICPEEAPWNGTHCVWNYQMSKYAKYIVNEFSDYTVTDKMDNIFILESYTSQDLQKGENKFWSYQQKKRVFGGKYVWAEARFSQVYNLQPHYSLKIYFQVIFGSKFPASVSNYLLYEINNSTKKQVFKTSNLRIIESINFYNPQLTVAMQCFGVNVVDSYCAISNYQILVNYCRPFCLKCTNQFDCQQWDLYDQSVIKLFQTDCSSNQFIDEETFTCETCPDECLTCFNEYECLSCQNYYSLHKTTCVLDCQVNQYYDGINCLDCLYSCKQCTTFSDCIHCETTNLRILQDGNCICYDGYYDQNNISMCQSCNILCKTCTGPTNNDCKQCIILTNIIQIGQTCQCDDGYYFDYNLIQCQLCHNQCLTCFGNSNSNCLSCYASQFRQLEGLLCICQEGYYEYNLQCQQCPNTIDYSLLQCFKDCGDWSKVWFNVACSPVSCLTGFENINNKCISICGDSLIKGNEECDDGNSIQYDGCHNCKFQCPIQCTICDSTTTFPCSDVCGDGFTTGNEECDDGNNIQYDGCYQCKLECQIQCTKCLKGLCSECQTFGWILNPLTRLCIENCGDKFVVGKEECDDGQNLNPNDGCFNCKNQCRNDCLTCSSDGKTCLECLIIGFRPQNYFCVNICGDGYLAVDPFNRYVEQCDDFNLINSDGCSQYCQFQCQPPTICTTCVNNKCQSCASTYYLDIAKNKCIELCNDNIIVGNEKCEDMNNQMNDGCYNCQLSCQPSCQTCNVNGCQTCKSGYQLINKICKSICGDKIVVSDEDCDDGNLIPFDGCHHCKYFCDSTCKVCHKGKCLECENGFKKVQFQCIQILKINQITQIKKVEINGIINCQVHFQSTCLKCYDNFDLNTYNNECKYQEQKDNFYSLIFQKKQQFFHLFQFQQLNCKYYLNDYGCLQCYDDFTFDQINIQQCHYNNRDKEQPVNQIEINNIYDRILSPFKPRELNCKFFLHENDCLECANGFSLNFATQSCNSNCGDLMINDLEQCEDSNQLQFDGCYDCQYQCCEFCQICQIAKCKKCQENYFFVSETKCVIKIVCSEGFYYNELKNECYDICGDGIISKNEECDDGNNIPFDGCYYCKYQCPKQCSVCQKGDCLVPEIECERGFYYIFELQQCKPICGDGILALPFEECDDGNDSYDDECVNCLLQCNKFCKVCLFKNQCSVCKENYELVDQTCLESQNNQCQIENCKECNNDLCVICQNGFILIYGVCQSQCGDGILVGTEQCDDGNLINGDGCDEDCLPSKNSLCNNQECIFIHPPSAKLIYLYEQQGEQFVMLEYNQRMKIADGHSFEDYLQSLDFKLQGQQSNISKFTILDLNSASNELNSILITIKIVFLQYLEAPALILNITDTKLLLNENNIPISDNLFTLNLQQPNILNQQDKKSIESLVNLSEQNLKILAIFIAIASITGKLEIIENILNTIQQLYYLKYLNCRIGINLGKFYQTFKTIQLANILDYLNLNTINLMDSQFQYFNSEIVFQNDDRNANFIPNLIQFISVFVAFTVAFYALKIISKYFIILTQNNVIKQNSKIKEYLVSILVHKSINIQQTEYWLQFQQIFSAIIYEYGISSILAIKYSERTFEGNLGIIISIVALYLIFFKLIIVLNQNYHGKSKVNQNNRYVYLCIQKFYFIISFIVFYHSAIIQIFANLLSQLILLCSIYQFKIFQTKAENLKNFVHHLAIFLILLLYLGNELFRRNVKILILIAWAIIAIMSLTLVQTTIIDLITLFSPIVEKITYLWKKKQSKTSNQILCTIDFSEQGIIRQMI